MQEAPLEASCAGQGLASGGRTDTVAERQELRNERLQRVNEALVKRAQGPPRIRSRWSPRGGIATIGSRPARIPIVRAPRLATPSTWRQANPSTASSTDSVDVGNVMSVINAIGKATAITIGDGDGDVGAHARDTHIRVPRVTAHRLNEALLLAGQSSKQIRMLSKCTRRQRARTKLSSRSLSKR